MSPDIGLDHLRGIAIGLVLVEHLIQTIYGIDAGPALGSTGMAVFFVLSGFLITSLLQREEHIDIRNFYLRRVVRLPPALIVVSAFIVAASVARHREWLIGLLSTYTYTSIAIEHGLQTDLFSHACSCSAGGPTPCTSAQIVRVAPSGVGLPQCTILMARGAPK